MSNLDIADFNVVIHIKFFLVYDENYDNLENCFPREIKEIAQVENYRQLPKVVPNISNQLPTKFKGVVCSLYVPNI